jgi:hypothetical protein
VTPWFLKKITYRGDEFAPGHDGFGLVNLPLRLTHAAIVDGHIPGRGRRLRSRAHNPNKCGLYLAQQRRAAPFPRTPPQRRAVDPVPDGATLRSLHTFAQEEPQGFDNRLVGQRGCPRSPCGPSIPSIRSGHQAAHCGSQRTFPVSLKRKRHLTRGAATSLEGPSDAGEEPRQFTSACGGAGARNRSARHRA